MRRYWQLIASGACETQFSFRVGPLGVNYPPVEFETTKNMQVAQIGVFVILFCFDVILKRTELDGKGNLIGETVWERVNLNMVKYIT